MFIKEKHNRFILQEKSFLIVLNEKTGFAIS